MQTSGVWAVGMSPVTSVDDSREGSLNTLLIIKLERVLGRWRWWASPEGLRWNVHSAW